MSSGSGRVGSCSHSPRGQGSCHPRSELLHFVNTENKGDSILRPSAFGSGQEDPSQRS
jgi:hypothetical protein